MFESAVPLSWSHALWYYMLCCGAVVLEKKCPYCQSNVAFLAINANSVSKEFCLGMTEGGKI